MGEVGKVGVVRVVISEEIDSILSRILCLRSIGQSLPSSA